MTQQLLTGIAGYGSELVHHSVSDLRFVRTAVCRAVGRSRAGNSPYLSTCLSQVMFWRGYFRIFRAACSGFLVSLSSGRRQGASAFLGRNFQDHGWTCKDDGLIEHARGWSVNWLHDSKAHLRKLFLLSWNLQVCQASDKL